VLAKPLDVASLRHSPRNKKMNLLLHKKNQGFGSIQALFEAGKVTPVINKCYPLIEAAHAFQYFSGGHAKGKLVIKI
jgi:NADPH:quinone reductase-like Zn-dependent oxidoreductase